MEIVLTIPEYLGEGLRSVWENDFKIETKIYNGEILISANKAGLVSLAKQLLTLAQDNVPENYHLHFDEYNSLETGSSELIIQKID